MFSGSGMSILRRNPKRCRSPWVVMAINDSRGWNPNKAGTSESRSPTLWALNTSEVEFVISPRSRAESRQDIGAKRDCAQFRGRQRLCITNRRDGSCHPGPETSGSVSYTHLRAHETVLDLVCRLLLEKKKKNG